MARKYSTHFVFKVSRTQKICEWVAYVYWTYLLHIFQGRFQVVSIKHLDGTSGFEFFLQIARTVGSRGFASPTDAFSLDKHSWNLKILFVVNAQFSSFKKLDLTVRPPVIFNMWSWISPQSGSFSISRIFILSWGILYLFKTATNLKISSRLKNQFSKISLTVLGHVAKRTVGLGDDKNGELLDQRINTSNGSHSEKKRK